METSEGSRKWSAALATRNENSGLSCHSVTYSWFCSPFDSLYSSWQYLVRCTGPGAARKEHLPKRWTMGEIYEQPVFVVIYVCVSVFFLSMCTSTTPWQKRERHNSKEDDTGQLQNPLLPVLQLVPLTLILVWHKLYLVIWGSNLQVEIESLMLPK